jgi:Phage late-transcription coactivator
MPSEQIEQFSSNVERLATENDLTYIEAVVEYCEQTEIEVESAAKLLSMSLKAKIQKEAEDLHFVKKCDTAELTFGA